MSYHTHTSLLFHCVFSTKKRLPSIPSELKTRLWSYVGGIARTNDMKALKAGGMREHLHVLLSLPPTMAIAKAIQLVKAGSSKWMHEKGVKGFEWQVGYGAFTIGISQILGTVNYIRNQEKHHAKRSFAQEWKIFMKKHGLSEDDD
ncbi:MAG TPA: IS200/IS605 family transposase [Candidatus Angelobacter sp.]|nr:IS200/IS605 family transposase [Candidatus Angelobacter sp.]